MATLTHILKYNFTIRSTNEEHKKSFYGRMGHTTAGCAPPAVATMNEMQMKNFID